MGTRHRFLRAGGFLHASNQVDAEPTVVAIHLAFLHPQLNYSLLKPEYVPELPF